MRPKGHMPVFTNATVHEDVAIALYVPPDTGDECVSIFFGAEQLNLDFYDPDVLDRVAAVAREGARVLRARLAESDDEQSAELAG